MKLNKMTAAMVLAGVAAAPMAQADVTLTGQVAIGIIGSDQDDVVDDAGVTIDEPGDFAIFGDDTIINVNATEELSNGLTAYGNYRTDLGLVGDAATGDNIHVGIRGDFGDVRIGEVPDATGFGQVAGDVGGAQISSDIDGEDFGISYTGSFSGATIGVNWSPAGSSDRIAAGIKYSIAGFGIGAGWGDDDELGTLYSLGATYDIAGASVAVAYKDFDNERETFSATAAYGWNDISLGVTLETEVGDVNEDDVSVRFDAGYNLGASTNISTRVNIFTDDSDDDGDFIDYRLLLQKTF